MYPFREESDRSDLGHVTYPSPTSLFMKDSYLASLGQILTPMAEIRILTDTARTKEIGLGLQRMRKVL